MLLIQYILLPIRADLFHPSLLLPSYVLLADYHGFRSYRLLRAVFPRQNNRPLSHHGYFDLVARAQTRFSMMSAARSTRA